ncbi:dermonecrotic toxin domain-containing protein [Pseudomonas sp. NPDC087817]|uniref:dermonecrotic toxin domain-containing protein n=1 Tax=Pseudomonas sp. NPDC087817 TaxID=3364451 RepID=UPI00380B4F6B
MQWPEGQQPAAPIDTSDAQHPDEHYLHLVNTIPDWLGTASPRVRLALRSSQPALPASLQAAPVGQHQQLQALGAAHWRAQSEVDQQLKHLQDVNAFAEPLLKAALKTACGLDLDVRKTFLRLYVPATTPWFAIKTGASRAWTVSLLDAALHNFEDAETKDDAYERESTFITQPSASGQFETLPAIKSKLSISAFIKLCRTLDIGAQYQTYLKKHLGFNDPAAAAALQRKVTTSQQAALKAALQWARMSGDLSENCFRLINGLLDGVQGMRLDGQTLLCHDVSMMAAPLTGILVFAPDAYTPRHISRVVAYVPDDPEHPIKEYASSAAMEAELTRQLRTKDYQRFFSRFIDQERSGFFFADLQQRLARIKWHKPEPGSSLPAWREEPIAKPDLQLVSAAIPAELWRHSYQAKLNKILNDAKVIAIPTATVDSRARWARWDSLVNIATSIIETAAFAIAPFVPGLGELMMSYMAYQLLNEAFEGIIDWTQAKTSEAFEHLMGTVESLVQLGAFAAGGMIGMGEYRKVLPKEIVTFIDRFKPVERPGGPPRYWEPDLTRYEHNAPPALDSRPDARGLHPHQGKQLLALEDAHYAVSEDSIPGQFRIEHPTRPEAYKPLLRHNGEGAWHSELEQPLAWDQPTALRRIGHSVESFEPVQQERILHVSGYNEDALRKMHIDQESVPPLLADTIKRFKIDQDLQVFIEQLDSAEHYRDADPLTQLQLLTEHGAWPSGKRLCYLNSQGELIWQSSSDEALPTITVRQNSAQDADLLKNLLESLDEQDVKGLLGESFGGPTLALDVRTQALRRQLSQFARQHRCAMFESRYQQLETTADPLAAPIRHYEPLLPASVTRELLDTANTAELLSISEGQLPERQQQLVQQASQQVRISRAYEGLELDSVSNADTDTLALHSLQRLPGWSGQVRIEIRDGFYEGPVLDSTGPAQAREQKVLVRKADSRYQPFDDRGQELSADGDFFSSVLHALPDAERQTLDLRIGDAGRLKQAIRANPLERGELRVAMAQPPLPEPLIDTLRLLGVEGYRPLFREAPRTLEERVREIYPSDSLAEIQAFIDEHQGLPGGVRGELSRLDREYRKLCDDLRLWALDVPLTDPQTGLPLTPTQRRAALQSRSMLRSLIQRCWRKQTRGPAGYMLQITDPILGHLPSLDADFSHVTTLTINGSKATRGLEPFLQRFPKLMYLDVQSANLPQLPPAITAMPILRHLILRDCSLGLGAADQTLLASLPELTFLDLQDNPLGTSPDIQPMTSLRFINLTNTGITAPPANLLHHPRLVTGKFAGNRITEIPDALFTLNSLLSDGFNFADNPLSAASRERVKAHYQRTTKHFGVLPEEADVTRTVALFPTLEPAEATDVLYQLPGTLDQGRTQLTQWEAELSQMKADLAQWSRDTPKRNPSNGQLLNLNEQASEVMHRERFAQTLEQFWGTRDAHRPSVRSSHLEAQVQFAGDMPTLAANFSHVSKLSLTGNKSASSVTAFLQRFQNLEALHLRHFDLEPVSTSIIHLPRLSTLELKDCAVVLTPENQDALCAMPHLETLELSNNPLGTLPDLNLLPQLTYLDVANTGLSTLPGGVTDHPHLRTMIFSGNAFTELPAALFELPSNRSDGFDFADNPLTPETREQIKTYYRKHGNDFEVLADAADIALARKLFPSLDAQEASDMIYDLPGTLNDGHLHLGRWQAEFDTMKAQLATWASQVPIHNPVTGEVLTAVEVFDQYAIRLNFKQKLEEFWAHRSAISGARDTDLSTALPFMGEMPVLTVDFSHVSNLALRGNPALQGVESFLDLFPNAQTLEMRDFELSELPTSIGRMTELKDLNLHNCQITLTAEGQNTLTSLTELERLDLSQNPLGLAPDLATMPRLNDVRLSNCSIADLPNGLADHPNLRTALLDSNRITELPAAFFQIDLDLADGVDLYGNPLSTASRERIKAFYLEHACDLGVSADPADLARARALFPALQDGDASHMLYSLPGTLDAGRAQLLRWEGEIARMNRELDAWTRAITEHDPQTGQAISADDMASERSARSEFSSKLQQFWRQRRADNLELRSNTFIADLTFDGDLPALSADFSHVTQLSLLGKSTQNVPDAFLNCFPGLTGLEMRDFALGRLPQALTRMPQLQTLVLSKCGVVFDAQAQVALAGLPRLVGLDLYHNPLAVAPDLSPLKALSYLDLAGTGIDSVPTGLTQLADLQTALLNDNRITELPDTLFNLPDSISKGIDLDNNPLSPATREQIKAYYQRTGSDLCVLAEQPDIELAQALYPHLSETQASDLVYGLPSTLADGRLELARRKTELNSLISELESWMNAPVSDPVTQLPLETEPLLQEQYKRMQVKSRLEDAWRRKSSATQSEFVLNLEMSFIGDLPALQADFGHILELDLTSTAAIAPKADGWLGHFPNLQSLKMRGFELGSIPAEVFGLKQLTLLNLPECNISLTEEAATALGALEELGNLNLRNNPLGRAPDISRMQQLTHLDLSNTGLTETWPALFERITLTHADLSNNAIIELPIEFLRGDHRLTADFDFSGNPLSEVARKRLADYAQVRGARLDAPRLWRQQIAETEDEFEALWPTTGWRSLRVPRPGD